MPADPLAPLFAAPDTSAFVAGFCRHLRSLPAGELPAFRSRLESGWKDKSLPSRHAGAARSMLQMRVAETDPSGFFAASGKDKREKSAAPAHTAALLALLATDKEAAIKAMHATFQRDDMPSMEAGGEFLGVLAATDPARALAEFTLLYSRNPFAAFFGDSLFSVWARTDATAAWRGIDSLPPGADFHTLRGAVIAVAATRTPAAAVKLLKASPPEIDPRRILDVAMETLCQDSPGAALEIARGIDSPWAWQAYAMNARAGTDAESLGHVLEIAPAAYREAMLKAFFFETPAIARDLPGRRATERSGLIRLVPVKHERDALALSMAMAMAPGLGQDGKGGLPAGLVEALLDCDPVNVALAFESYDFGQFLAALARSAPEKALAWFLPLGDADWRRYHEALARAWPDDALARDVVRLLASSTPREKEFGHLLLERWIRIRPADAIPFASLHAPDHLPGALDFALLVDTLGGNEERIATLLASIADPNIRGATEDALHKWRTTMPPPAGVPETAPRPPGKTERIPPLEAWNAAVRRGLKPGDDRAQAQAALAVIAKAKPRQALELLMRAGQPALHDSLLSVVVKELLPIDPPAVFAALLELPPAAASGSLLATVTEWAKSDPQAACAACLAIPDPSSRTGALHAGIRVWATSSPGAAIAWIGAIKDPATRAAAMQQAFGVITESSPARAAALYLETWPKDDRHEQTALLLTTRLAETSFAEACRFLLDLAGTLPAGNGADAPGAAGHLSAAWHDVTDKWSASDPVGASAFLSALPRGPAVDSLQTRQAPGAGGASDESTIRNPRLLAVADVLLDPNNPPASAALAIVNDALANGDPEAALSAACQLPAPACDLLVRRILAAMPDGTAAVARLPEAARSRATALLEATLPPSK